MADVAKRTSTARRQSSRLQRRAPASIQISPVTEWNVAIPLLSPLVQSPVEGNKPVVASADVKSKSSKDSTAAEKPAVLKKWQNPAHPFCYNPAPMLPFVSTGTFGR